MDYFIIKYAKMRQQEIQQEFEAIHRARMSRPEGVNRQHGEVAFAMHAKAARDEMKDLAREFQELTTKTPVDTPNIDKLKIHLQR
jgi:hypothetical protein